MPTTYYLSNRQQKELLIRGASIRIALPVPDQDIDDTLSWARSVLPPDLRPLSREAVEDEVRVSPLFSGSRGTLTEALGHITANPADWTIGVAVVIVRLAPDKPRTRDDGVQWPSHVVHHGMRLPRAKLEP